jgi:hypothetical protein
MKSSWMKLRNTLCTSWTIPGTLLEMREVIVRKKRSSNLIQSNCTEIDLICI